MALHIIRVTTVILIFLAAGCGKRDDSKIGENQKASAAD